MYLFNKSGSDILASFGLSKSQVLEIIIHYNLFYLSYLAFVFYCHYLVLVVLWHRFEQYGCGNCIHEAYHLKHMHIQRIYTKLLEKRWSLVLLTRRPVRQKNATIDHLVSMGYRDWSSLIMRYYYYASLS